MGKISPKERREYIRKVKEERRKREESEGKNKKTHLTPSQQRQMMYSNLADELKKRVQTFEKRGESYFGYRNDHWDYYLDDRLSKENERWFTERIEMRKMISEMVRFSKNEGLIVIMELIKKYNKGGLKEVAEYASKSTEPTKEEGIR